ncbi:MAG: hypothetical protein MZW92_13690 [Comamonadaceae bacterium]|nr:hypothetical protein [Comamonadaceae bacterium]
MHQRERRLHCHHCGSEQRHPGALPELRRAGEAGGPGHRAHRGDAGRSCSRTCRSSASTATPCAASGALEAALDRVTAARCGCWSARRC